jgi:hypothetical protein
MELSSILVFYSYVLPKRVRVYVRRDVGKHHGTKRKDKKRKELQRLGALVLLGVEFGNPPEEWINLRQNSSTYV